MDAARPDNLPLFEKYPAAASILVLEPARFVQLDMLANNAQGWGRCNESSVVVVCTCALNDMDERQHRSSSLVKLSVPFAPTNTAVSRG